jgi:predicted O-linked N-acetylglucosamine transferase (SPINDLY family)
MKAAPPFAVLALTDSSMLQRQAAETWVAARHPERRALPPPARRPGGGRIRIGYFSADYHGHATAHLVAGLLEAHDRERFEIFAFSFGPASGDEMRTRISAAVDRFIDVRDRSDQDVAQFSRSLGIDIAVDLKGFTSGARPDIFANRAAPVQVSYLGYPGTMGAGYIDYIIADRTVLPEDARRHYSEKVVYLPYSYQVNDDKREIADVAPSRAALGLPSDGFVFCCFNASYKIEPGTFRTWMRILQRIEGSVLWLFESNPAASASLRKEAEAAGVGGERLVFAEHLPQALHLARHRAADLFLDTRPCNAHTTASDALWAGLPVLTCAGESFASRVAASLLNAIGLPELVTTSPQHYEALAMELARDRGRLSGLREKLARNRLAEPLFDTARFTKHIESAYMQMDERHQADLPPDHFDVVP